MLDKSGYSKVPTAKTVKNVQIAPLKAVTPLPIASWQGRSKIVSAESHGGSRAGICIFSIIRAPSTNKNLLGPS
jgi:hypothetical protein